MQHTGQSQAMVAPVSGNDVGIKKAEIKGGIREVVCCKDAGGKIGLRVRAVNKGLFVAFVHKNSPGMYIHGSVLSHRLCVMCALSLFLPHHLSPHEDYSADIV